MASASPPESPSEAARTKLMNGFKILGMSMRDADTNELMWSCGELGDDFFDKTMEAHIPPEILGRKAVARKVRFSSTEVLTKFRMVQKMILHGQCIEEWPFDCGFVMPGSTNEIEHTISAASDGKMIPAEVLSGNLTIITQFFDGDFLVGQAQVRAFYDGKLGEADAALGSGAGVAGGGGEVGGAGAAKES